MSDFITKPQGGDESDKSAESPKSTPAKKTEAKQDAPEKAPQGRAAIVAARNKELTGGKTPEELRADIVVDLKSMQPLKDGLEERGREVNDSYSNPLDETKESK